MTMLCWLRTSLLSIAIVSVVGCSRNPAPVDSHKGLAAEASHSPDADTSDKVGAPSRPPMKHRVAQAPFPTPPPDAMCDGGLRCEDSPLVPWSVEEQAWLRRNGYPTEEEARELAGLSEAQLQRQVDAGSLPATVELGVRLGQGGEYGQGLVLLMSAARKGSLYAYHGLARMHLGSNHVDAKAYLRVAYLLGDYKAANTLYRWFPRVSAMEMRYADERAALLYMRLSKFERPRPRPMWPEEELR